MSVKSEAVNAHSARRCYFECAKREPSVSQLATLATIYNRPVGFFLSAEPLPVEVVRWRKKPVDAAPFEVAFLQLCQQYQNLESWCDATIATTLPPVEQASLTSSVRIRFRSGSLTFCTLSRALESISAAPTASDAVRVPRSTSSSATTNVHGARASC